MPYLFSQVNEDTKANVSDLQQKLTKVTMDSESRVKEFQEKLSKVRILRFLCICKRSITLTWYPKSLFTFCAASAKETRYCEGAKLLGRSLECFFTVAACKQ